MSTHPDDDRSDVVDTRVVVGVDGSQQSRHALAWAQFLAGTMGATVEAVIAWMPVGSRRWEGHGYVEVPDFWDPAGDAKRILEGTVEEVFGAQRPAGLRLTAAEGGAAKVLLDAGRGARLLVVGSRGHGGFYGLLIGSVSAACAEHASCPVLVMHGDDSPPRT